MENKTDREYLTEVIATQKDCRSVIRQAGTATIVFTLASAIGYRTGHMVAALMFGAWAAVTAFYTAESLEMFVFFVGAEKYLRKLIKEDCNGRTGF